MPAAPGKAPAKPPILVLQMQRMGDLILSFPLLLWLARRFPGHPIWVAAEKMFYEPLLHLSPPVTYFPWEGAGVLARHDYRLVLNLSIREDAARLAGTLRSDQTLGPVITPDGRYVRGDWQLYRASIVCNNRYNRFHWADLNALDCIDPAALAATTYQPPAPPPAERSNIGLFLGASDPAKRPAAPWWAALLKELRKHDLRVVLFGGPAEADLGRDVQRRFKGPVTNLCGKLSLLELSRIGSSVRLFVTPDTGPMHLAAWLGMPTLNLSMGNVHPWETGPYQPGHHVLRPDMDCARGCWSCPDGSLACHKAFNARDVAYVAWRLFRDPNPDAPAHRPPATPPGQRLLATGRDPLGLYRLRDTDGRDPDPQDRQAALWHAFFAARLGPTPPAAPDHARQAAADLAAHAPETRDRLAAALPALTRLLARPTPADLLAQTPPPLAPLAGWAEHRLQNTDNAPDTRQDLLETVADLAELLEG
ncbi:MAG: glycosyltransferase family 9 protein [Desulfovibrionaceae bacterium]